MTAAPALTPAVPTRRGMAVLGRLGWGVADQAVSSLSNFVLGLYVARSFGASSFGAFTLAWVTYAVVLNAARGLGTDPLLVRFSGGAPDRWRRAVGSASATALAVGIAAGAVCVAAGALMPGPVGPVFVALGVGLPGLMLQDSWRFAFFAAGRGASALANDVVWGVLLIGTLVAVQDGTGADAARCVLAFGLTATVAAVVGGIQARVVPRAAGVAGWLREHRQMSVRYMVENVSFSGTAQIRSFVLGAVVGLAAVGYVRAAETLMGPFLVVLMGISQVAVPEASRVYHRAAPELARFCFRLGLAEAAGAVVWSAGIMLVLPLGPGRLLLKDLWEPASALLLPVTLMIVGGCFSTAANAGLRATGMARRSLRAQLVTSGMYLVGGIGGVLAGGAAGTCWGAAVATCLGTLVWWRQLRLALTDVPIPQSPNPESPNPDSPIPQSPNPGSPIPTVPQRRP